MITNNYNNTPVNFGAWKIGKIHAQKYKTDGKLKPKELNLVEIDTSKMTDLMSIDSITKSWKRENTKLNNGTHYYLTDIYNAALKKHELEKTNTCQHYYSDLQIFAATKQKFLFRFLNPNKICAIAQVRIKDMDIPMLDFLQVRPKYQHANPNRKIKDIGKGFLKKISDLTHHKKYGLFTDSNSIDFYKQYGAYPDEYWDGRFYVYD